MISKTPDAHNSLPVAVRVNVKSTPIFTTSSKYFTSSHVETCFLIKIHDKQASNGSRPCQLHHRCTHTHPVPDFFRQALVDGGYTEEDGELWIDGYMTPKWSLESFLVNREKFNYDYSVMSITAPGLGFLNGNSRAISLARRLNDQMHQWTEQHPDKLGAFACLPLPNIEASLEEIKYCLDVLKFDGVGLYTNYHGRYIGDAFLTPIFEELNRRGTTCLVHPVAPTPEVKLPNLCSPAIEYCFDTTRAVTSMLISGARQKFLKMNLIFSHGGGAVPLLAGGIIGQAGIPYQGGLDPQESTKILKGFYYDLAAAHTPPQLAALNTWVGSSQLLIGSDTPYFPEAYLPDHQAGLANYQGFTEEEHQAVRHGNALRIFPHVAEKLTKLSKFTS